MATNPLDFIQQTRSEIAKVVWPSRREVLLTTAMVLRAARRWPRSSSRSWTS